MPPPESKTRRRRGATTAALTAAVLTCLLAAGPAPGTIASALASQVLAAREEPEAYAWPVAGPVLRGFEPPPSRFEAGHRGIDIGATLGTPVRAAAGGTVAFAGWVAGSRFVSIDHPDGVRTTYSWLSSVDVGRGTAVSRGQVIGATGHGHAELDRPHLHFGARIGEDYVDPLILLGAAGGQIHLAPLEEVSADRGPAAPAFAGVAATAAGLPAGGPLPRPHWLWSRTEPRPLVVRLRGPPAGADATYGP